MAAEGDGTNLGDMTADQAAAHLKTLEDTREIIEAISKINDDILQQVVRREGISDKVKGHLEQHLATLEKSLVSLQKQMAEAKALELVYQESVKTQEAEALLRAQKIEVLRREKAFAIEKAKQDGESATHVAALIQKYDTQISQLEQMAALTEEYSATLSESVGAAKSLGQQINKLGLSFQVDLMGPVTDMVKALQGGTSSAMAFFGSATTAGAAMFVNNIAGMALQLINTEAAFRKATGASAEMATMVTAVYEANREYGITAEESSAATQALWGTFTDFTMAGRETQEMLADTATTLGKLGVANEDFAKGIQISTKALGMSTDTAEETQRELVTFAKELGVTPQRMAADFANAGNIMAKMGDQGVQAFKDLAHVSKITGMEMQKVLNITNKFDTFEGAAEQAGKLNAALGGNFVNAMDLMMETDPAERFKTIRDSILDAGLSFDDMSYYQKNFYKDALGLSDVGDLAMMLSGNIDEMSGVTQKSAADLVDLKQNALAVQSVQEKLNAAMAAATPVLVPLLDKIISLTEWMGKNADTIMNVLSLVIAYKGAMMAWALASKAWLVITTIKTAADWAQFYAQMALADGIKSVGIAQLFTNKAFWKWAVIGAAAVAIFWALKKALMIESPSKLAIGLASVGTAMFLLGRYSDASTPSIQRAAISMLQLGAGVFLVTGGVAMMAAAFSMLNTPQLIGLGATLLAIGAGVYFLTPALAALGAALANPYVAAGLAVFALTMLSIGASIFIAAAGVGLMAAGLSLMFREVDVPKLLALAGFMYVMIAVAPMMVLGAYGFAVMGLALLGLVTIINRLDANKAEAFASALTTPFTSETAERMLQIQKGIKGIVSELEHIPERKTVALATLMTSTTADGEDMQLTSRQVLQHVSANTRATVDNLEVIVKNVTNAALTGQTQVPKVTFEQPLEVKIDNRVVGRTAIRATATVGGAANDNGSSGIIRP